jgi:hypothetical protein
MTSPMLQGPCRSNQRSPNWKRRQHRPFEALLQARQLDALSPEAKSWIAMFVAVQCLRVRNFRETMKHLDEMTAEKIRRMGGDPSKVKGWIPARTRPS